MLSYKYIEKLYESIDENKRNLQKSESEYKKEQSKYNELEGTLAILKKEKAQKDIELASLKKLQNAGKINIMKGGGASLSEVKTLDGDVAVLSNSISKLNEKIKNTEAEMKVLTSNIKLKAKEIEATKKAIATKEKNFNTVKDNSTKAIAKQEADVQKAVKEYKDLRSTKLKRKKLYIRDQNHRNTTLYDAFKELSDGIDMAFKEKTFADGCVHTVKITENFEIVLMLDSCYTDKDVFVSILFRVFGDLRNCVRMYYSNVNKNVITIEKLNINSDPTLNYCPQNISTNCIITLCLLFCTFIEPKTIELKDCDCFVENGYRQQKFNEAMEDKYNQPRDKMYSHDFSYFEPYGFTDKYYNTYDPLLENCDVKGDRSNKYCKANVSKVFGNKITEGDYKYVLMTKMVEGFEYLETYLRSVKITVNDNYVSMEQLCQNLECKNKDNVFCRNRIFHTLGYRPVPIASQVPTDMTANDSTIISETNESTINDTTTINNDTSTAPSEFRIEDNTTDTSTYNNNTQTQTHTEDISTSQQVPNQRFKSAVRRVQNITRASPNDTTQSPQNDRSFNNAAQRVQNDRRNAVQLPQNDRSFKNAAQRVQNDRRNAVQLPQNNRSFNNVAQRVQNDRRNAVQTPSGNAQRFQNAVQRSAQQQPQNGQRFRQVVRDAQQSSTDRSMTNIQKPQPQPQSKAVKAPYTLNPIKKPSVFSHSSDTSDTFSKI